MEGVGTVVGKKAPDFTLVTHQGIKITLSEELKSSSVLLAFYPGDFTPVCTRQLCNYRDRLNDFSNLGIKMLGISANTPESHAKFVKTYGFHFPLLSDPDKEIARLYNCRSLFMFGGVSRAVVIINRKGVILYHYVEPTVLTRRSADELIGILEDLEKNSLL